MAWRILLLVFLLLPLSGISLTWAQDEAPVMLWSFDRVEPGKDVLKGNYRLVQGVKGKAIVMDGYTTCVVREADQGPKMGQDFTIEAWTISSLKRTRQV